MPKDVFNSSGTLEDGEFKPFDGVQQEAEQRENNPYGANSADEQPQGKPSEDYDSLTVAEVNKRLENGNLDREVVMLYEQANKQRSGILED